MPWLMERVDTRLCLATISRHLLDTVIRDVVRTRTEQYSQLEMAEHSAAQRQQREHAETTVDTTEDDDEQQASSTVL